MKPLLCVLLCGLALTAAATAGPPLPDPDPSVRPGTPLTLVAYYWDYKPKVGRWMRCYVRPHKPRRCVPLRRR